jgi:hypothetical protein
MAARYEAGESLAEIGQFAGINTASVRRRLDGLVEPRKRGRPKGSRKAKLLLLPKAVRDPELSWEGNVVARLREIRAARAGVTFAEAWAVAGKDFPPRGRDAAVPGALFDENGEAEVSHVDFFREACRVAWHGEQPGLARFSLDLLASLDSSSAARVGRYKALDAA